MSTHHTTNYNLNQWEATDKVLRTEFNEDNAKIDAALKSHDDELAELEAAIGAKGNCKIVVTTYQGTGEYGENNPSTVYFSQGEPTLLLIIDARGDSMLIHSGSISASSGGGAVFVNWGTNSVSWYSSVNAGAQMNNSGTYQVFLLYSLP